VLQLRAGLTAGDLAAIADLERRTLAADGGRLKLEWGELDRRDGGQIEDLLWWEARRPGQERLIGFLGLYAFGPGVELAGMVDPAARRSGMATRLLHAARPLLQARACAQALLVCPRATTSGALFSAAQQAPLDHSEYALILAGDPSDGPTDSATSIADACRDDEPAVRRLLESAFGHPAVDGPAMSRSDSAQHLVVRRDGAVIGYLRLSLERGVGGIYGFVLDPSLRGRGIGRDVLARACRLLRDRGATSVGLEVAVDNDSALGLYTSTGFVPISTEDYFRLPPEPVAARVTSPVEPGVDSSSNPVV